MSYWAIINSETNIVENTIHWDGLNDWQEPAGTYKVNIEGISEAFIGCIYDSANNTWTAPELPAPVETPKPTLEQLQQQLAALTAQITALANTGQ